MRLSLKIKKRFQIFFRYVHGPITVLQKQSKQPFIKQLTNHRTFGLFRKISILGLVVLTSLSFAQYGEVSVEISVGTFLVKYKVTVLFWISEATESRKKIAFNGQNKIHQVTGTKCFQAKRKYHSKMTKSLFRGRSWKK